MTGAESPAALLRRAAGHLDALHASATSPWVAWDNIHGDPVLVSDQARGRLALVAEFSTAPNDYGRANVTLAAALRPAASLLAAQLRATSGLVGARPVEKQAAFVAGMGYGDLIDYARAILGETEDGDPRG